VQEGFVACIKALSGYSPGGTEKITKPSVRIVSEPAEIRTGMTEIKFRNNIA
jgi:hypothetical protein